MLGAHSLFNSGSGFAVFVAGFQGMSLVVFFLASPGGNPYFDVSAFCEDLEWHNSLTLFLEGYKLFNFFALGEQLAGSGAGGLFDRNAGHGRDGGIDEPELLVFNSHVGSAQLAMAMTKGFCLGASQNNARQKTVVECIIMASSAIAYGLLLGLLLFGHAPIVSDNRQINSVLTLLFPASEQDILSYRVVFRLLHGHATRRIGIRANSIGIAAVLYLAYPYTLVCCRVKVRTFAILVTLFV